MFSFILSRFLSPSKIAFFVLIALCGFLYLKNNALALENENLKLKALHFSNEINVFKDKLAQQNKAIDKLKLDLKPKETLKEVLKVDKVFIKDKSCQSELKAYKELFNILGAKKVNDKMRIFLLIIPFVFLSACASKDILIKTEIKEVKVPIKCPLKLPLKPLDKKDLESAKEISKYYLEVENIAKLCTGEKDERK